MSNQRFPTPENIVSITYQLLQQSNDAASIRGQLPILSVQFQDADSVLRNKIVGFGEMLPYLRMLHAQAVIQGKEIVCNPESTYDKKIVLSIGVNIAPIQSGNVTFKLNGVDFTADRLLENVVNISGAGDATRPYSNVPFCVTFEVPYRNTDQIAEDFLNEYEIAYDQPDIVMVAEQNLTNDAWLVTLYAFKNFAADFTIDVTHVADGIQIPMRTYNNGIFENITITAASNCLAIADGLVTLKRSYTSSTVHFNLPQRHDEANGFPQYAFLDSNMGGFVQAINNAGTIECIGVITAYQMDIPEVLINVNCHIESTHPDEFYFGAINQPLSGNLLINNGNNKYYNKTIALHQVNIFFTGGVPSQNYDIEVYEKGVLKVAFSNLNSQSNMFLTSDVPGNAYDYILVKVTPP